MTEPEKMTLASTDIATQKREQMKELFPEIFVDNEIDYEQLKRVLGEGVEPGRERFGLNWPGRAECMKIIQQPSVATLRPDRKESINFDETENLFIEGENLEVLKLLLKSYFGKIKMIYIDPPYNTGNEFVYPDNYTEALDTYLAYTGQIDESSRRLSTNTDTVGRYHSNWLNMMYPRLYLAKNLLREDGVIFISIDDNEFAHLRNLCDTIFGEDNHVGVITVRGNPSGRDYGGIARMHDYVLVYKKSSEATINNLDDPDFEFSFSDNKGGFVTRELRNRNTSFNKNNRPNLYYPFYLNLNKKDSKGFFEISLDVNAGGGQWKEVWPKESQNIQTVWRWGKDKSRENLNTELVGKAIKNGGYQIVEKYREKSRMARSMWYDGDVSTQKGTLLVKKLFGGKVFDFPKPLKMLSRIVEMGSERDSIILDFFAGSATTAHAVMAMNQIDGGSRKYIMVQLPEPNKKDSHAIRAGYKTIADIGKERIRRAAKNFTDELESQLKLSGGKPDLGFKVFKLSRSNFKIWEYDVEKITDLYHQLNKHVDHINRDSTEEDILYEILLKAGFSLTTPIEKITMTDKDVFAIEDGAMLICLDKELNLAVIEAIAEANPRQVICLDQGFKGNDQLKANAVQTFKARSREAESEIVFKTI